MIYLDPARRVVTLVVIAVLILGAIACSFIGVRVSYGFGCWIFGGITLGPVLTVLVQQIGEWRLGSSLDVIGRDVSVPRAVAVPTQWRDTRWQTRDVRYAPSKDAS